MRKKLYAIIAIVALCVCVSCSVLQMTLYYKRDYFDGLVAMWNNKDSFVFVQINTTYEKVPRWKSLLVRNFGIYGADELNTCRRLIVFHVNAGKVSKFEQNAFDIKGQFVPWKDTPHFVQGGKSVVGFRWDGSKFVLMDFKGLAQLQAEIKKGNLYTETGWSKLDWEELGKIGAGYSRKFSVGKDSTVGIEVGQPELNSDGYVKRNPPFKLQVFTPTQIPAVIEVTQQFEKITKNEFEQGKTNCLRE
jgi:hypothetical protein